MIVNYEIVDYTKDKDIQKLFDDVNKKELPLLKRAKTLIIPTIAPCQNRAITMSF